MNPFLLVGIKHVTGQNYVEQEVVMNLTSFSNYCNPSEKETEGKNSPKNGKEERKFDSDIIDRIDC